MLFVLLPISSPLRAEDDVQGMESAIAAFMLDECGHDLGGGRQLVLERLAGEAAVVAGRDRRHASPGAGEQEAADGHPRQRSDQGLEDCCDRARR
jgi:hypothetical protein